jgi:hypothetical protein
MEEMKKGNTNAAFTGWEFAAFKLYCWHSCYETIHISASRPHVSSSKKNGGGAYLRSDNICKDTGALVVKTRLTRARRDVWALYTVMCRCYRVTYKTGSGLDDCIY